MQLGKTVGCYCWLDQWHSDGAEMSYSTRRSFDDFCLAQAANGAGNPSFSRSIPVSSIEKNQESHQWIVWHQNG